MKLCPKCQKQFSDDANFCPVDAARLVPLEAQAQGGDSLAARFELGQKLGGGRTGAVHRAADKQSGAQVVVKLVAPAVVGLPGVAQRLERELRQLERVQSAGVARVLASGKRGAAGDETWVAMEMVDGAHTLAEAISARGPIPVDQAADLIEVVGEALIEAAQVGVVHRDLAPKNVLFAGSDVKLINFSLPVPTTDKVPGVAEFVAPEQVDGRPVDQRSNLYSLGALYYFVLTGQPVFAGSPDEVHRQHQSGTIRPPSALNSAVAAGSAIEGVIMRALDRSPTKRFLTVRQFVDEVARVGRGEVIELQKAKRPKAELVSTLMGVRHGGGSAPVAAPAPAPIASAPTVGAGVPSVAPASKSQPNQMPAGMVATMIGVSSGAHTPSQPVVTPAAPAAAAHPLMNQPATSTMQGRPIDNAIPNSTPALQAPPMQAAPMQAAPSPVAAPSPAPVPQPAIIVDSAPATAASPWAAPANQPAQVMQAQVAPVVQAPVVAAPVVAAPVVAAPVVAAPVVAKPDGKRGSAEQGQKGKFRETMWFKKGDLDTQAAVAAAEERARTGKEAGTDKADSLPMDERYKDDGTISRQDKEKYSLRTGGTQMMQAVRQDPSLSGKVSEDELIGEMKGGRKTVFLLIGVAVIALVILIVVLAR
ncbi:MAG: protein kinase [Kofleriaceae bacterium]